MALSSKLKEKFEKRVGVTLKEYAENHQLVLLERKDEKNYWPKDQENQVILSRW